MIFCWLYFLLKSAIFRKKHLKLKYIYCTEFWRVASYILQLNLWNWSKNLLMFVDLEMLLHYVTRKLWRKRSSHGNKWNINSRFASFVYSSNRIKTKQRQTILPSSKSNSINSIIFLFMLHLHAACTVLIK